jgi:hypothetical protein
MRMKAVSIGLAALLASFLAMAQQNLPAKRMIVLGVDGMDPVMLQEFMR